MKYANERNIRTVGPALVFVLELEAPPRFEILASTEAETERVMHWSKVNDAARAVCEAYFSNENPAECERADEHADRLAAASPLALGERVI